MSQAVPDTNLRHLTFLAVEIEERPENVIYFNIVSPGVLIPKIMH